MDNVDKNQANQDELARIDEEQQKVAEGQDAANLNPAIPANPASSQVAKLMAERGATVTDEGGGGVKSDLSEHPEDHEEPKPAEVQEQVQAPVEKTEPVEPAAK